VEGRLRTRSWDNPDGQKRYRTEVVADRVLFLDRPGGAPLPEENEAGSMIPSEPDEVPFE
jgi:single-strand DNA-binding protein